MFLTVSMGKGGCDSSWGYFCKLVLDLSPLTYIRTENILEEIRFFELFLAAVAQFS